MLGATAGLLSGCAVTRNSRLVGAASRGGEHHLLCADLQGHTLWSAALGFRGHETLIHNDHALILARRPGTDLVLVRLGDGQVVARHKIQSPRHLYGHGLWMPDGEHILTVENDYDAGRGVVAVRDRQLDVVALFDSGGIGPHQLAWLEPGKTIVVANGGLLTHPAKPRQKLNKDNFVSNLTIIDVVSGELIGSVAGPVPAASMRHLTVLADGRVFVGYQYEGSKLQTVPLVGVLDPRRMQIAHPEADDATWLKMQHYVASVAASPDGATALATCPRGHCVTVWDLNGMGHVCTHVVRDTAGVDWDARNARFALTSGVGFAGALAPHRLLAADMLSLPAYRGWRWDNHVTIV